MMNLPSRRIGDHALQLPAYAHDGDAGLDLAARILEAPLWGVRFERDGARVRLHSRGRVLVPTGIAVALPAGHYGQIQARSSAFKAGFQVAPGVIDAGYRGEIRVGLFNIGDEPVEFTHGDRVAQLLVLPVAHVAVHEVSELDDTARGDGGFGSTGR